MVDTSRHTENQNATRLQRDGLGQREGLHSEDIVQRADIRNVAIIAHVDHGKTTLVDAMLWQSGVFRSNETVAERVMDSMDLEKEKGITILAKNTAVRYKRDTDSEHVKINIVDTPGHADFGGEVERALTMVEGVVLLVDAGEGPLPQTRFVLGKALAMQLPVVLVINKIDRADARIAEVTDEVYELFFNLNASDAQIDFPIVYTNARLGTATLDTNNCGVDLRPLFETILNTVPAPEHDLAYPLQAWVTNLDASEYIGRIAMCKMKHGTIRCGQNVAWCRTDGSVHTAKITQLYVTEALDRVEVVEAGPGEIIAIAGIPDIMIGETLTDISNPRPLPLITVDNPSLSATIGINTSPMLGREGSKLTARLVKSRLDAELVGNVSIKVFNTERPDAWEVHGRGELQLAVLVEMMRREGFELTVGKPHVVTRMVDGQLQEPTERLMLDVPEESIGAVTQMLGERKADMVSITNHAAGQMRLEYVIAARGLIGFRTEFLSKTRGNGLAASVFEGYTPWVGELRSRRSGSVVADRRGSATSYAVAALQERTSLFVSPGDDVYEGMIVGENQRPEDMDVNICREKKQTNIRAAASDDTVRLTPPRVMSLEQALDFIADDECVEVTPTSLRLRKENLNAKERSRLRKQRKYT